MKFKEFLKKNSKFFFIWTIVGWAAQFIAMAILQPWGEGLGVAESPIRNVWLVVTSFWFARLPMLFWGASMVAKREEWLAPRGKYVEGKSYPLLSTFHIVAIGLMTALFAATGAISWQAFDLGAAIGAIATIYFGPFVGFFTVWLGGTLRQLLFAAGGNPVSWFLGVGPYDGTTWMFIGIVFWLLREKFATKKSLAFVLWVVFYILFRAIYEIDYLVWLYPGESFMASLTWWEVNFMPTSTLSAVAGALASIGILETNKGGTKRVEKVAK